MKVKSLALILGLIILSDLCLSNSFSFLNSSKILNNIFEIGENKTKIQEEFNPPSEIDLNENQYVTKKVMVSNNFKNNVSSYVRVKVIYSNVLYRENITLVNLDTNNWTYDNGWYYYNKALKKGESTTYLFQGVRFNKFNNKESIDKKFSISIYEESIEAKGNSPIETFKSYENGGSLQ